MRFYKPPLKMRKMMRFKTSARAPAERLWACFVVAAKGEVEVDAVLEALVFEGDE